jgi:hypothetical protein
MQQEYHNLNSTWFSIFVILIVTKTRDPYFLTGFIAL